MTKAAHTHSDDKIWFDTNHKLQQISCEIQHFASYGQPVIVIAHFAVTLAALERTLRSASVRYQHSANSDLLELPDDLPAMSGDPGIREPAGTTWLGLAGSCAWFAGWANLQSKLPLRIIVAEHHPRYSPDQSIIDLAQRATYGSELCFHIALDDPLLKYFGGGSSLQSLLEKLGLSADGCISHPLVTRAIRNAQEKIERKVPRELPAESIQDWFKYNLPERAE
jgi:hypothetical protein